MRVLLALAFAAPLLAQEPVAVNSKVVKVEFENDRIRVLRVHYGPHEKRDMEGHPAKIIVALTGSYIRMTLPDGTSREWRPEPGTVTWTEPERYAVENLSDGPMEDIEVELKRAKSSGGCCLTYALPFNNTQGTHAHKPGASPSPQIRKPIRAGTRGNARTGGELIVPHHSLDVLYVILADAVATAQEQGENWGRETAFRAGAVSFDNASKIPHTHHLKNIGKHSSTPSTSNSCRDDTVRHCL